MFRSHLKKQGAPVPPFHPVSTQLDSFYAKRTWKCEEEAEWHLCTIDRLQHRNHISSRVSCFVPFLIIRGTVHSVGGKKKKKLLKT